MKRSTIEAFAMVSVAAAGVAWGIFWIPLRALDESGIVGAWAVVCFYVLPTVLLSPIIVLRRHQILGGGWPLPFSVPTWKSARPSIQRQARYRPAPVVGRPSRACCNCAWSNVGATHSRSSLSGHRGEEGPGAEVGAM